MSSDSGTAKDRTLLIIVAFVHLTLYVFLVFEQRYLTMSHVVTVIGFLLGQSSLVTVICVVRPGWWLMRQTIPWAMSAVCWFGLSHVALWGPGTPGAGWWAIGITAQTLMTLVLTHCFGSLHQPVGATHEKTGGLTWRFPLRSLIFLSTLAAVGFSIAQYGQEFGMWSTETIGLREVVAMTCVGAALATSAWLCQWMIAATSFVKRLLRLVAAGVSISALGLGIDRIAAWANMGDPTRQNPGLELLLAHAVCVGATLVILYFPQDKRI